MTDDGSPNAAREAPSQAVLPYRLLSARELFALRLPDLRWAVEGLLPLGSFNMLAAREKAGKGLLMLDLCCSVALGEPFLGRAVEPGPALYVAAEENIRDIRDRLATRLAHRRDDDPPVYLLPVNGFVDEALGVGDTLRIDDPDLLARLYQTILDLGPVLVVLDPLRELHNQRENESDDMGATLRPLRQIAHATGCAIVINHHMSVGGRARGSTSIRAAVDQEWALTAKEAPNDSTDATGGGLLRIQGRFGSTQSLAIVLAAGHRWDVTDFGPDPDADLGSVRGRILGFLLEGAPDGDGLDADTLAHQIGATKRAVQGALAALLAEDPPPIATSGRGVRGDPRRFHLTDAATFGQAGLVPDDEEPAPDTQPPGPPNLTEFRARLRDT